jgi:hypothetical protein
MYGELTMVIDNQASEFFHHRKSGLHKSIETVRRICRPATPRSCIPWWVDRAN